jgi:hypothetical protein
MENLVLGTVSVVSRLGVVANFRPEVYAHVDLPVSMVSGLFCHIPYIVVALAKLLMGHLHATGLPCPSQRQNDRSAVYTLTDEWYRSLAKKYNAAREPTTNN